AHLRINNHACADVSALRKHPKSVIRGMLWLTSEPRRSATIQICDADGVRSFAPQNQLSLGGKLLVFAADGLPVDTALEQLCGVMHGKLVRQLLKQEHSDRDTVAAHVAHALYVRTVRATDLRGIEFPCFAPRPLDARSLTSLFRREDDIIA